ncbi:hypothetical protein [Enterococcus diestrammenae]|uniref:hypothetical protein n=1 Tax=Enterococcus diestrammenae TaxID=1155073 RepID=UPI00195B0E19
MSMEIDIFQKNEKDNPINVEVVQLIKVTLKKGSGGLSDPVHLVDYFYDFEGKCITTRDDQWEDD